MINKKTELEVVVSIIENPEVRQNFFIGLNENDFGVFEHKNSFIMLREQYMKYGEVDLSKLENGSLYAIGNAVEPFYCDEQIKELRELSKKRSLKKFSSSVEKNISGHSSNELIEKAVSALAKIKYTAEPRDSLVADVMKRVNVYWDETRGKELVGVDTGTFLNKFIRGYRPSHYWVVGAYTNYGKTSFAAYLCAFLVKSKVPTAFFSAEMSSEEIAIKILTQYLQQGEYQVRDNVEDYQHRIDMFSDSPLSLYDDRFSLDSIRLELFSLKAMDKLPKVVFVDFIQNITAKASNRYEMITAVTQGLQQLAKELRITIIALSQISNEGANTKTTSIPFKGSGEIASSADFALQLNRNLKSESEDQQYAPLQIKIVKNRHGRHQTSQNFRLNLKNGVIDPTEMSFPNEEKDKLQKI